MRLLELIRRPFHARRLRRNRPPKALSLQDEAGMWAEYYDDNRPAPGYTRCRPWESGINIEAALRYLQAQG